MERAAKKGVVSERKDRGRPARIRSEESENTLGVMMNEAEVLRAVVSLDDREESEVPQGSSYMKNAVYENFICDKRC